MNNLIFDGPINQLSLGNVSYNFLKEIWKRNVKTSIFPVGNSANFDSFDRANQDFLEWIKFNSFNRLKTFNHETPVLKNWHINGSESRFSKRQYLYTFYEVDSPTEEEVNIVSNQDHVFFSSSESCDIFKSKGCDNVSYVPLGFDEDFFETNKSYLDNGVIHFGLIGKLEHRKNTQRIIQLWLKKYGDNPRYQLTCLINNPFFKPEDFAQIINQTVSNRKWKNINFLPFLKTNSEVNELMNAIDIDLSGISNGEGWNLPAFNATALGKWSVVSNCSSHKDWATRENSILIEANNKQPCYDNFFFRQGAPFNQGNYYLIKDESIIDGFERAEKLAKTVNEEGKKLKNIFTYSKSIDKIFETIKQ
jgi:hypothetical protein